MNQAPVAKKNCCYTQLPSNDPESKQSSSLLFAECERRDGVARQISFYASYWTHVCGPGAYGFACAEDETHTREMKPTECTVLNGVTVPILIFRACFPAPRSTLSASLPSLPLLALLLSGRHRTRCQTGTLRRRTSGTKHVIVRSNCKDAV